MIERRLALYPLLLVLSWASYFDARPPAAPSFGAAAVEQGAPVEDPTGFEFSPSSDHATLVSKYVLSVYSKQGGLAVKEADIGKPEPVDGVIRYTKLASLVASLPRAEYIARMTAVGIGGSSISEPSNSFIAGVQVTNPCNPNNTGSPVIIVITRLTRAVSRSDPEGAIMLFRASSIVPLRRIKIDILEVPDLPGWEMTYSAGTLTSDVRGFAVRPGAVGTWPLVIEAEDTNGCIGKTDGSHRITVVP